MPDGLKRRVFQQEIWPETANSHWDLAPRGQRMVRRAVALVAVLAVAAAGFAGLAVPANAAQVTLGFAPGVGWKCHADVTVVPYQLLWLSELNGWQEDANITGNGTCETLSGPQPLTFQGFWVRNGPARDAIVGECPLSMIQPSNVKLGGRDAELFDVWYEVTNETAAFPGRQIIAMNPLFIDQKFGVPAVGISYGIAQTDPAACAAWPTTPAPPPNSFPTPPPFHFAVDWTLNAPQSLLTLCLTLQGVLPRQCLR
jgi:hypothetical protein